MWYLWCCCVVVVLLRAFLSRVYTLLSVPSTGFFATTVNTEYTIQRIDLNYGSFGIAAQTKENNLWLNGEPPPRPRYIVLEISHCKVD